MRFLLLVAATGLVAACSGTSTTPPGDGGSGSDGGSDGATATDGNAADTGGGDSSGGDSGACPDEHGAYSIQLTGQGCGDTSTSVAECITQTACTITLTSTSPTAAKGLNGTTPIQSDGSFTGAAITEGTVNRTGCVATWDSGTSTLTIDCGGVNTSQSCRATLTRTSTTCP